MFTNRRLALGWLGCVLLILVALALLLPRARINSSVLALLPQQTLGAAPAELQAGFMQRLDRQMVWLVSADAPQGEQVAQAWLSALRGLPTLRALQGPMDAQQQQAWGTFAWQHRNGLLDSATRQRLAQGGTAQADWVLAQLFSAFAGVSGKEIQYDPLLLVRGAQLALQQNASSMTLRNGWLTVTDAAGRRWYFIHGELAGNAFSMQQSRALVTALAEQEAELKSRWPQAQLLTRGTVLFSDHASQQAQHDISTLGSATIFGVLLLVWLVFRSLRPLLLCGLSVGIGAITGTALTLLIYGELHLMTLVMSLSIVGISADYTLYYLTERMVHGAQVSPGDSIRKVRPAMLLALATTAIAWLVMLLAPIPGLRQLAIFAASGLTAACLTVICWYPLLVRGLPVRPVPQMILLARWLAAWRRNNVVRFGIPLLMAIFALFGLARLHIDDDISRLQAMPAALLAQDRQLASLTGQQADQTWFVVSGASPQQALERLDALADKLPQAQHQHWLTHYRLLPLNSLARQQQDVALIKAGAPQVIARLQAAGVSAPRLDVAAMPVSLEDWLNSPLSAGWRLLWLSTASGQSGVLVPVSGVQNSAALDKLAHSLPGVSWVDRKASFDQLFAHYRVMLAALLAIAMAIIALSYLWRLGWRAGLRCVVPSLFSLAAGLAALGYSGQSLNLFALLALVLVLGIGINYTLFFSNPRGTPITSLLAVTLAMLTTLLTLGMLVFSATQAIASFGIVLCCGIFTAFLLAPLTLPEPKRKRK